MSCHATCIIGDATDHRRPEFFRQRMPHVFDQQQLRARNRRCNGLAVLDALHDDERLAQYQPYWAARADMLGRVGDVQRAGEAYQLAIGLESDPAVRRFLQEKMDGLRE